MNSRTSFKEVFSKPGVQWAIVIFLIIVFLGIIFLSVNVLRGGESLPPTIVIGTPNATVASILTQTAYATEHNFFPSTWTITATSTFYPTSTVTTTPTVTHTGVPTLTLARTNTSTPTRTKTLTPYHTAVIYRTSTRTPTITKTPTVYGRLTISKLPASQTIGSGGTAIFNITVTNSGPVALTSIVTTDTLSPDCSRSIGTLAVGASSSYTCTKTGVIASFTNFITVMGRNPSGRDVWANTASTVTVVAASPHITLAKTVSPIIYSTLGQVLNYTFVATNDGNVPLTNVTITDPNLPSFVCTPVQPAVLAVSATLSCSGSHTVTQADLDAGTFSNTATASGSPPSGPVVTGTASNTATSTASAGITITKLPASQTIVYGTAATFNITVTNSGGVTLTGVTVTDALASNCNRPAIGTLAPAAFTTYSCTLANVTASFTNTAIASGTPPSGPAVTNSASATVTVNYNPHISLTKGISSSTYSAVGQVLNYTLTATNDGNVSLTSVSITDAKLGALVCTPSQPATLAPSATLSCTGSHTVIQNDLDYGSYYNTATVSGTPPTGPAVTASDSKTAVASTRPDRIAASIETDADGDLEIVIMNPTGLGQVTIDIASTDMHLGSWSPLGDWLVYDTGAAGHLYMVRPDGTYNTLIPNLPSGSNTQPSWSPDGTWIVFVNNSGSQTDLYIIHPDGTSLTRMTNDSVIESDPSWLTSVKLIFVGDSGVAGNNEIYTLVTSPLGSPSQLITFAGAGLNGSPYGKPDGTIIVFARNDSGAPGWDIWLANGDGSSPSAYGPLSTANADIQPSWSRDVLNILFLSDSAVPGTYQMYIGDGVLTMVADGFSNEINPRWMP
jgi:uncharacterized repeat protein (TIGR01451 family)